MRNTTLIAFLCILSLFTGASARASTLLALDLPALVDQSDYVVVANARTDSARYVAGTIVTDVTLEVVTSMKGSAKPGELLVVTHLGGAVGDVGLHVPGAARFTLGQSSLVFLRRGKDHTLNVTGMSQGVMPITGNGSTALVAPMTHDATLMQRDATGKLVEAPAAPNRPRALADLLAEIEQLTGAAR